MKKSLYWLMGLSLLTINEISFAVFADPSKVTVDVEQESLDTAVQRYLDNFMAFLYLIAVIYALWGGFQVLTAGGDEEKVSTGKKVLVHAGIWLVVIFLASAIIGWILSLLT